MKRLCAAAIAIAVMIPSSVGASRCLNVRSQQVKIELPDAYWDMVAICESSKDGHTADWRDKGRFAGGLGIYVGAWRNFGGHEFAPHPSQATREQQIEVANRIAVWGYQTKNTFLTLKDKLANRPFFRPASGYYGWGCIRNRKSLNPRKWEKKVRSAECRKP